MFMRSFELRTGWLPSALHQPRNIWPIAMGNPARCTASRGVEQFAHTYFGLLALPKGNADASVAGTFSLSARLCLHISFQDC